MSWLRSARMAEGAVVDVESADGRISQVVPASGSAGPDDLDLTGYVLLPSFVEPHAHLDKALLVARARNGTGDLRGALAATRAAGDTMTREDIIHRAERAIKIQLAYGTTAIRTHVNVGGFMGMRALEALVEVRERWRGLVDLQIVALPAPPFDARGGKDLRYFPPNGAGLHPCIGPCVYPRFRS